MTAAALDWNQEISTYLGELTEVQRELLDVLNEKRAKMAALDAEGLEALQPRANELAERLSQCHSRRQELLAAAASEGKPSDSLRSVASSLAGNAGRGLETEVNSAADRVRLLRHHSVTNWVAAQRTLLHLAEMLEIIATGGRLQSTYSPGEAAHARGMLLNHEA